FTLRRAPSSTLLPYTTLFRSLLILENYEPDAVFTVTGTVAAARPTKIGLRKGDRMRVGDLLAAALVHSANDACRALAEWHSGTRSEEHTSELQSRENLVCRLL